MRENVIPLIKYDSHVGFEAKKFLSLQWYSDDHQKIQLCLIGLKGTSLYRFDHEAIKEGYHLRGELGLVLCLNI